MTSPSGRGRETDQRFVRAKRIMEKYKTLLMADKNVEMIGVGEWHGEPVIVAYLTYGYMRTALPASVEGVRVIRRDYPRFRRR